MPQENTPSGSDAKKTIRVVINGIHAKSGGGVTYLRKMLPELAVQPDIEMHLLIHIDQFDLFYPIPEGIHVTTFTFKPTLFVTFIWEQFSLPLIASAMGANVVFSPANYGPVFARNHVILLRNAVSVIHHIDRLAPALYWTILSIATLVSFITCKRAIAVSNYAARILTFNLPSFLKRKLHVVYHGATPIIPSRSSDRVPGVDLLAVSDIYIQKNYHSLVEAFALIKSRHPALRLNIVGREIDNHYAARIRSLVKKLGIDKDVQFMGHLGMSEIDDLYRSCLIFVFPSVVETFGNPLLEAMSAGAPIACSATAAMPEVIGDAGLLFNPYDVKDIAAKIEQILADPDLQKSLGAKALLRSKQFTWKTTADKTTAILRDSVNMKSLEKPHFR